MTKRRKRRYLLVIDEPTIRELETRRAETGTSVAETIRRAIRELLAREPRRES
jgi:hypothetical protein